MSGRIPDATGSHAPFVARTSVAEPFTFTVEET